MLVKSNCSSCSKPYQVPDDMVGKQIRCPHCKTVQTVAAPANSAGKGPLPLPRPPAAPARPTPATPLAPPGGLKARLFGSRPLLLGGLVLGLLLVVGGAVLAFSLFSSPAVTPRPPAAQVGAPPTFWLFMFPGKAPHPPADPASAGPVVQAGPGPSAPAAQAGEKADPGKPSATGPVAQGEDKPLPRLAATEATLLLQLPSLDKLFEDVQLLAETAGKGTETGVLLGVLRAQLNPDGLPVLESKKPWGAYARVGDGPVAAPLIALIPISDETRFLNLLRQLQCTVTNNADGTWTVKHPQLAQAVSVRLAHGYAYATLQDRAALKEDHLLQPAQVFVPQEEADLLATFRIDRLPEQVRSQFLAQLRQQAPAMKGLLADPGPAERTLAEYFTEPKQWLIHQSPAQRAYTDDFADWLIERIEAVIQGGQDVSFRLYVNAQTRAVLADVSLAGKPGSRLAGDIAALAEAPSLFGELTRPESAFSLLLHLRMPAPLRQGWGSLVQELTDKTLETENDPAARSEAERLFRALEPTVLAGELDMGLALRYHGSGQPGTVSAGIRLVDGQKLDQVFRELVQKSKAGDRKLFSLHVAEIAGTPVHRHDVQDLLGGTSLGRVLGRNPNYLAFRKDAVFGAGGANGQQALEAALKSVPQKAALLDLRMNLKQMIELDAQDENEKALARRCFTEAEPGRIRLTLEGGEALRLRGSLDLSCVRYVAELVGSLKNR